MAGAANPAMTMNPFQGAAQATMAAGQAFANPNVNQFMNPYQQQVVDATIRDVGNAAQMGLNNIGAQAQGAGAYGGSRQGIMEAEALKGFNQQALDQVSRLNQQGFNNAMNNAFRSAQGLQGVGSQAFNMGQAINQQQLQQGSMQQQLMQNLINAARGQYGQYANAPMNKLQLPLAALGAAPVPQTQTQSRQLGIMDYLTAGLSGIAGMPSFMG
tara:strand:- start:10539 stop:11180 length:642 start_codon:yes stop_codon:yes gene_type:complete